MKRRLGHILARGSELTKLDTPVEVQFDLAMLGALRDFARSDQCTVSEYLHGLLRQDVVERWREISEVEDAMEDVAVGKTYTTDEVVSYLSRTGVLRDVSAERERQDAKWGEQNHVDFYPHDNTHPRIGKLIESAARGALDEAEPTTWTDILLEEVGEVMQTITVKHLRLELVQVAAVAVSWIEAIDRRYRNAEKD